jgi:aromatic-L-amino-acid/L-tryptophan decarboxylase
MNPEELQRAARDVRAAMARDGLSVPLGDPTTGDNTEKNEDLPFKLGSDLADDPEAFRAAAHAVIDWICDYRASLRSGSNRGDAGNDATEEASEFSNLRVLPEIAPGDIIAALPSEAPHEGERWADIFADFKQKVFPGVTHWQHPQFFSFFPANTSEPGMLGEFLSAALNQIGFVWLSSPACTELEVVVMDWLVRLLDLPESFLCSSGTGGGSIQGTASEAVLVCLIAARRRAVKNYLSAAGVEVVRAEETSEDTSALEVEAMGKLVVYTSDQAHSSVKKACMIAGTPMAHFRVLETDSTNRFDSAVLRTAIERDVEQGLIPCMVVATFGATSTTAIDPLRELGEVCRDFDDVWFHIDAAYAGAACVCPEFREMLDGVELATSFNFNPHKWLLVPFDCSALFVTDRELLVDALSVTPEYLRNTVSDSGQAIDYRDWQVPLGRRFRALKVWFVLRSFGRAGLQRHIREHVRIATELENWIEADSDFEVVQKRTIALVSFRMKGSDEENRELMDACNASGRMMLTHTVDNGVYTIRWSVGALLTQAEHVRQAWDFFKQQAAEIRSKR